MFRFVMAVFLLFPVFATSQDAVNPSRLDSLSRSIEQSGKALKSWQDSFNKKQDSVYRSAQNNLDAQQNIQNINRLLTENKKRSQERQQRAYIRIGIGVLFLVVLLLTLYKRKKKPIFP